MSLSMYSSSVPIFVHYLKSLAEILKKAQAYAETRKIDEKVLASSRLFPDMLPLTKQVQIACDVAKGCAGRLAGVELPKFEDNEETLAELVDRIAATVKFLESIAEDKINGTEEKEVVLKVGSNELEFVGAFFLRNWAIPNVFFHITTTYNILRHSGVEIGKMDFLGAPKK